MEPSQIPQASGSGPLGWLDYVAVITEVAQNLDPREVARLMACSKALHTALQACGCHTGWRTAAMNKWLAQRCSLRTFFLPLLPEPLDTLHHSHVNWLQMYLLCGQAAEGPWSIPYATLSRHFATAVPTFTLTFQCRLTTPNLAEQQQARQQGSFLNALHLHATPSHRLLAFELGMDSIAVYVDHTGRLRGKSSNSLDRKGTIQLTNNFQTLKLSVYGRLRGRSDGGVAGGWTLVNTSAVDRPYIGSSIPDDTFDTPEDQCRRSAAASVLNKITLDSLELGCGCASALACQALSRTAGCSPPQHAFSSDSSNHSVDGTDATSTAHLCEGDGVGLERAGSSGGSSVRLREMVRGASGVVRHMLHVLSGSGLNLQALGRGWRQQPGCCDCAGMRPWFEFGSGPMVATFGDGERMDMHAAKLRELMRGDGVGICT